MRSQYLGALALFLVVLPFDTHAYTVAYDFRTISDDFGVGQGTVTPLPDAILNATQWEVVGSIVFSDDGREFDDYQIIGGSLSINGVSLGSFTDANYHEGYSDEPEPGDDPDFANFGIFFNSEDFGLSTFSIYSEDYSGGINYGNAISYLSAYPVGGYQETQVTVGNGAFEVYTDIEGFVPREVVGPEVEVSEPPSAPLVALGIACIFWLRRRGVMRA